METFKLNNGVEIPKIGIGTFMMKPDDAQKAVVSALQSGYRLIDTANGYMNEKAVGRGIKESGVDRKDIFVSSKLWPTVYEDNNAVDDTLKRLGLDYLDLLFIHQPAGNWEAGYKQLEKAYKAGKVKAIGISNFQGDQLRKLFDEAEIKPQVMQAEAHPYYPETELKKFLKPYGTRIMAWYPLGHGDKTLIQQPIFSKLAKKYNKSNVQIILRWHIQEGNIVIPGSTNPAHIKANADIFDFKLSDDDMTEIAKVNKNKRYYHQTPAILQHYASMKIDFNDQK